MIKRSNGYGAITIHEYEMFSSIAYRTLTKTSTQILSGFLFKRQFKNKQCINCNYLTMTYAELTNKNGIYCYTLPKIARAFDELLAKGFIEIVKQGGRKHKDKTIYKLVDSWKDWIPGQVFQKREKKENQGFQK